MKRISHILCPTDFSKLSERALKVALRLKEAFRTRLTVLHVQEEPWASLVDRLALENLRREEKQRSEKRLADLEKKFDLGRARFELTEGRTHRRIGEKVSELGADLVVMGTHGASGWQAGYLGSVTEKVLHDVTVPLLAVPGKGRREPLSRPGSARILLAVDLGSTPKDTVDRALDLAKGFQARLMVLHVAAPLEDLFPGLGSFWAESELTELETKVERARVKEMDRLLPPGARKQIQVEIILREGSAFEVISQTAAAANVDMLVIGAHGHGKRHLGWLGSTAHKVIRLGVCPTLVVRP